MKKKNILLWQLAVTARWLRRVTFKKNYPNRTLLQLALQLCALWNSDDRPEVYLQFGVAGVIPQSLQCQGHVPIWNQSHVNIWENAQSFLLADQCVYAVRGVKVPVLVCLRNGYHHVTAVGGRYCLWDLHWKLCWKLIAIW